jgi:hypothetical protein
MTEISLNKVVDVRLRDDDNGDFFLSGSSSKRAVLCGVAADCAPGTKKSQAHDRVFFPRIHAPHAAPAAVLYLKMAI